MSLRVDDVVERMQASLVADRMRALLKRMDATASRVAALDVWDESQHPRGQPENKGEFAKKGTVSTAGAGGTKAEAVPPPPQQGQQQATGKPSGKGVHPGANYSKGAYIDEQGSLHAATVEDAALALYQNALARKTNPNAPTRKIILTQTREVATLLDRLATVASDMIVNNGLGPDGKPVVFDLCDVTVQGTNLFCVDNKGIPRVQMPQFNDAEQAVFVEKMKAKYGGADEEELAGYLRATQSQLDGGNVAKIAKSMREQGLLRSARLIVSADNYIVDGHHRWAAIVGNDAIDGNLTQKMEISRINIPIMQLIDEANAATSRRADVGAPAVDPGDTPGPKARAPGRGRSGPPTAARSA